ITLVRFFMCVGSPPWSDDMAALLPSSRDFLGRSGVQLVSRKVTRGYPEVGSGGGRRLDVA
ncbi:hypothetical protein BHM03_00000519, partial [Ensete ventricosum]